MYNGCVFSLSFYCFFTLLWFFPHAHIVTAWQQDSTSLHKHPSVEVPNALFYILIEM